MDITRTRLKAWAVAAAASVLGIAATPSEADACGGFFCSRSPVDQTAEHIIFTVNADHTVTAYVQIQYEGDKDNFAWIVPAPGVPALSADFPNLAMTGLDTATQPSYFKGQGCAFPPPSAGGFGGAAATTPTGVTVLAKQSVGPFETVTLEGTSADVLVKWLNDNGYRVTNKMIPLIQPYVEGGMHFVAVKLQANKDVSDIQPMGMTYDGNGRRIGLNTSGSLADSDSKNLFVNIGYTLDDVHVPQGSFRAHTINSRANYSFSNNLLTSVTISRNSLSNLFNARFRLKYIFRKNDNFFLVYDESHGADGHSRRALTGKFTYTFDF